MNKHDQNPKRRPRDANQLAKRIVDLATSDVAANAPTKAAVRAKKAGQKGGPARAKALTPAQRSEIARIASEARWKKGS